MGEKEIINDGKEIEINRTQTSALSEEELDSVAGGIITRSSFMYQSGCSVCGWKSGWYSGSKAKRIVEHLEYTHTKETGHSGRDLQQERKRL